MSVNTDSLISVAIKTYDRTQRLGKTTNFLTQTLQNLERSGFFTSPHLAALHIVDSGSPTNFLTSAVKGIDYPIYLHTPPTSKGYTLHQTAQHAIQIASDHTTKYTLVLEDDLDFCANFLESVYHWLEDHANDKNLMYAFGANYDQILTAFSNGQTSWPYPINAFYGAQALAWKTDDARQLATWLGPNPSKGGITTNGHDLLLQTWGERRGLTHFLASAPSFVQHVGSESSLNNRFFQFSSFQGRKWSYV